MYVKNSNKFFSWVLDHCITSVLSRSSITPWYHVISVQTMNTAGLPANLYRWGIRPRSLHHKPCLLLFITPPPSHRGPGELCTSEAGNIERFEEVPAKVICSWFTFCILWTHESRFSVFQGLVNPNPLRIFWSLAMAEFSAKSVTLFMWWRVFEACSQMWYWTIAINNHVYGALLLQAFGTWRCLKPRCLFTESTPHNHL